jgi:hypothetical protein
MEKLLACPRAPEPSVKFSIDSSRDTEKGVEFDVSSHRNQTAFNALRNRFNLPNADHATLLGKFFSHRLDRCKISRGVAFRNGCEITCSMSDGSVKVRVERTR